MEIRNLKDDTEVKEAWRLSREYTHNSQTFEEYKTNFNTYPDLFAGCFIDNQLIGEVSGEPFDEYRINIHSICVVKNHQGKGIGKKLIKLFEEKVKKHKKIITVASGKNSDKFYLKTGYKPQ